MAIYINLDIRKYIFFTIFLLISTQSELKTQCSQDSIFLIKNNNLDISVDGNIGERAWNNATIITNLLSPWDQSSADSTIFRCFTSYEYFNFSFEVIDNNLVILNYIDEISVAKSDRVELFFSSSIGMKPYYCLEINPLGQILDYEAYFYRKFDYTWNFNYLSVVGRLTNNGYIVEGRLPLFELQKLGLDLNNGFYLGVFRADFTEEKESSAIWYSWLDPGVEKADFHVPSALRMCKFN